MDIPDDDPKSFLSIDDLMALRKTRDLPVVESVCEKGYIPKESDSVHVKALLEDKKKLLELKGSARIGDLIQAEWRPDLKKAVTPKLKGKFTQHMGNFVNGNMVLCPEETMFLLENGSLELLSNGVPLSTEAAYAVVLNEDLALEKYMVYSYLSHLGFIVVPHREKLNYEKLATIAGKRKGKRKKKFYKNASNKKIHLDETFAKNAESTNGDITAGQLIRNVKQEVEETLQLQSVEKKGEETLQLQSVEKEVEKTLQSQLIETEVEKTVQPQSVEKKVEETLQSQSVEKEIDDSHQLQADVMELSSNMPNSSELNVDDISIQEQPILVSSTVTDKNEVTVISPSTADDVAASSPVVDVDLIVDENVKNDETTEIAQNKTAGNSMETVVVVPDVPDNAPLKSIDLNISANKMPPASESIDASIDNNSVELMEDETVTDAANSKNMAETNLKNLKSKATDEGTVIDTRNESSRLEKMTEAYLNTLNLRSDDDETSDSDVLCVDDESSQDQEESDSAESVSTSNEDSVQSVPDNEVVGAGDVVVLEVAKKEVIPLAVINLSSDEEEKSDDANEEDDDDEVQIIEECNVTRPSCKRENWYPMEAGSSEKREKSQLMMKLEGNRTNPDFPFPYLVRKRIVCLPRPPAHLLPAGVCLNKEAYTLDLKLLSGFKSYEPTPRVWNSYKDLQNIHNFKNGYNLAREFPSQGPSNSPQPNMNFNPFLSPAPFSGPQFPPFQNLHTSPHIPPFNMLTQDRPGFNQGNHSPNLPMNTLHSADPSNCQYVMEGTPPMASNGRLFPTPSPLLHDQHAHPQQNLFNLIEEAKRNTPVPPGPPSPWLRAPYSENTCRPPLNSSNGFHENQLNSPSNFENNSPFQGPNRNPTNPWMQNWRPAYAVQQMNPFPPNSQQSFFPQGFMGQQWRPLTENLYPCDIPKLPMRASSWQDLKSSANSSHTNNDQENNEDDEVEEVPIDFDEVLWAKVIHPLIRPGGNLTVDEVLKTLQITKSVDLTTGVGLNERYLPDTCSLHISFDLYLPGSVYRKTCPDVPHNRIVVTRSSDPFPKASEITLLLRKFKDNAVLQFAVVDGGDIAFYSFNCVNLPIMLPHQ